MSGEPYSNNRANALEKSVAELKEYIVHLEDKNTKLADIVRTVWPYCPHVRRFLAWAEDNIEAAHALVAGRAAVVLLDKDGEVMVMTKIDDVGVYGKPMNRLDKPVETKG